MQSLSNFKESYSEDEEYYRAKLTEDEKQGTVYFTGKSITWFGTPGKAIVIPIDDVYGMDGNIYDNDKTKSLVNLIENSIYNVELLTSYGYADVVTFINIKEHQISVYTDGFGIDYDGHEVPYSIGDETLDEYIGAVGSDNIMDIFDVHDNDFNKFIDTYKFALVEKIMDEVALQEAIDDFLIEQKEILLDDDYEILDNNLDQFMDYELALKEADENEEGDIGRFVVQLRDGHHRWQAAKEVGEEYFAIDLVDKSLKEFKGKYRLLEHKY